MVRLRALFSKAQLLLLLSFGVCVTALALTAPGTIILNRAEIFYQLKDTEDAVKTISNASSVAVGQLYSFAVENTHSLDVSAGEIAQFPHRIVNQGNVEDSYTFSFTGFDSEVFDPPVVYLDSNRNGRVDTGEEVIQITDPVAVEQAIDVVVAARVSHLLSSGVQKVLSFAVSSEGSDKSQQVTDRVTTGSEGELDISLRSFPECSATLFPNDLITHRVDARNTGTRALLGSNYVINDQSLAGLVLELPVTTDTSFYDFVDADDNNQLDGIELVQLAGAAVNEWISTDAIPTNATITSAGFFIESGSLIGAEAAEFTVQFKAAEASGNQSSVLTTAFYDADADRVADVASNSTCNTLSTIAALGGSELRFLTPADNLINADQLPDFYTDSHFASARQYQLKRDPDDPYTVNRDGMYLQLDLDNQQNKNILIDSVGNRYVIATIESSYTADTINVVLLETTTPGAFRSIAPIELSTGPDRSNGGTCPAASTTEPVIPRYDRINPACVLQSADSDELRGTFGDSAAGFVVANVAFVNRQSVVFDSRTLAPLAGSVVQILRADTDKVAIDSLTGVQFEFVTDSAGKFSMPRLNNEISYYLNVLPALAYQFPSEVPPFRLTDFNVHGFSYGRDGFNEANVVSAVPDSGVFNGTSLNAQVSIDIPLDPVSIGGLLSVDKVAMQSTVDIGQSLFYTVSVTNSSAEQLNAVVVSDTLPFGFRYIPGTTVIEGEKAQDPVRAQDGDLDFTISALKSQQSVEITYAVRATAAAVDGDGVNTVSATGFTNARKTTDSLPATAKVTVRRDGVFSNKAALFGKIYVDQNCDGLQNNKEWPIGGVRLYLQDGTYVITDGDGLFSVYGLDPGQYVVAVDTYTLPAGLDLKLLAVDQAADANSRFVDLSNGDFHRVDFAAGCPKENVERIFTEIKQRNQTIDGSWYLRNVENRNRFEQRNTLRNSTINGDLSNGILDGPADFDAGAINHGGGVEDRLLSEEMVADKGENTDVNSNVSVAQKEKMQDAKELVSGITAEQAKQGTWLWPRTDMSLNGRFMAVVRAGIDPVLSVNGSPIPSSHIGERMINRREKAQVVAWYGVELEAGENNVEIKGTGPFGNERLLANGVFKRPSAGASIELTADIESVPADGGRTTLPVTVRVLDSNGYPALGVYYITLDSSDGAWLEPDIQDNQPGRQIRIENGKRTVHYRTSGVPGEVRMRASTGEFSDELTISQVAERRPLVVSGFVEAGAYFATDELGSFSASTDLGDLDVKGRFESRAALFVKGTIKDNYNLTLSYDTDKNSDQQLLRDIDPTLHYPIHGDGSIRGFEAQSRSKLYVRIERDSNMVTWGDFLTDTSADQRDLGRINRILTGLNSSYTDGKNRYRVFAAQEENNNIIEEIAGNGSALLYRLAQFPIVANSETVEIITRSRENRGLILDSVVLNRLGDYNIDDDLGYLSFASAIPTLDQNQNPVFIRVTYDVEDDGEDYLVSGVRFDRKASERLSFGASYTNDNHSTAGRQLVGVYGDYKLGKKTRLSVSLARSDAQQGIGYASSVSVDHSWKNGATTSLTHVQASEDFTNTVASATPGRTETTIRHSQKLTDKTRLLVDANRSASSLSDDERRSLSAVVETNLNDWHIRGGLKGITEKTGNETDNFVTSLLGVRRKFSLFGRDGQSDLEYEQDLGRAERRRIAASAKLNVHTDVSAYTRYELSNSLLSLAGLSSSLESEYFTFGVESRALPSTKLYSEYRLRGAFESREYETANGVRGDYEVTTGLRISPHFEYIRRMGVADADSISVSVGVTDTRNPNNRKFIRLETRHSAESEHYGIRASVASRVNQDWTMVVTDNFSRQDNVGFDPVQRHNFVAAITRRPKYENKHHMLFMYQLKQERGVINGLDRTAHVLSTHQNLQVDDSTVFSGRLGVKRDSSLYQVSSVSDFAMLADARLSFDIGRRFNFDTGVGALSTNGLSEVRYSMGMGINYTMHRNLRLNLGYNLVGFKDRDLDAQEYNAKGAHVGLQYKLDEENFKWLN